MPHAENHAAQYVGDELGRQLAPQIDAAREQIQTWNEDFLAFAKARPLTTLAGALLSGFVLGKIVARL